MMTKLEYLHILESILKVRLNKREVDEIMRDYAEYFVEGTKQGKSDYDIANNLGDPREVANQIISESLGRPADYAAQARPSKLNKPPRPAKDLGQTLEKVGGSTKKVGSFMLKALLIFVAILLLPMVAGVAVMLLGAVVMVIGGLLGVVVALGGTILAALAVIVMACMFVGTLPASALVLMFLVALGLIAGSVLGICITVIVIRWIWSGVVWCWRYLYSKITRTLPAKDIPPSQDPAPQPQAAVPVEEEVHEDNSAPAPVWEDADEVDPLMVEEILQPEQFEEEELPGVEVDEENEDWQGVDDDEDEEEGFPHA